MALLVKLLIPLALAAAVVVSAVTAAPSPAHAKRAPLRTLQQNR